jgi:hypothetical protein
LFPQTLLYICTIAFPFLGIPVFFHPFITVPAVTGLSKNQQVKHWVSTHTGQVVWTLESWEILKHAWLMPLMVKSWPSTHRKEKSEIRFFQIQCSSDAGIKDWGLN